jgi:hypothetical protein
MNATRKQNRLLRPHENARIFGNATCSGATEHSPHASSAQFASMGQDGFCCRDKEPRLGIARQTGRC